MSVECEPKSRACSPQGDGVDKYMNGDGSSDDDDNHDDRDHDHVDWSPCVVICQ